MSQEISRRVGIKYKPIPKIGIEYVDEGSDFIKFKEVEFENNELFNDPLLMLKHLRSNYAEFFTPRIISEKQLKKMLTELSNEVRTPIRLPTPPPRTDDTSVELSSSGDRSYKSKSNGERGLSRPNPIFINKSKESSFSGSFESSKPKSTILPSESSFESIKLESIENLVPLSKIVEDKEDDMNQDDTKEEKKPEVIEEEIEEDFEFDSNDDNEYL